MLSLLHIENIAVIESAEITFDARLNLLTGETGAGKSIVIDALNALLGRRTSRELIRSGKTAAQVTGVFTALSQGAKAFLEEAGYPCGDELTVSRQLQEDGRNICRLDGKPASVSILRGLGEHLIDIHGQQDTGALLQEERHLDFLDSFQGIDSTDYTAAYRHYRTLEKERKSLQKAERDKAQRKEVLAYQIDEISTLNPEEGEIEQLTARRKTLLAADRIRRSLARAYAALYGDEDTSGACDLCVEATDALLEASRHSDEAETLAEQLQESRYALSDTAEEIRSFMGRMEDSEVELEQIESRLDALRQAERKYNMTIEALGQALTQWQAEWETLETSGERLLELEGLCQTALAETERQGQSLRKQRTKAAKALERRMVAELADLDMQRVRFSAGLSEIPPGPRGLDECAFLLSANPGEPLKPLSKTASGGEMARIMLALKNILAEGEDVPTLVFDEVDTGVSGRAAQRVAQKLCAVSRRKQVLCVTHLPQIAAMADTHFFIQKGIANNRTFTEVRKMEFSERVEELSRLVAGEKITDATRKNAEELLVQAESFKTAQKAKKDLPTV